MGGDGATNAGGKEPDRVKKNQRGRLKRGGEGLPDDRMRSSDTVGDQVQECCKGILKQF